MKEKCRLVASCAHPDLGPNLQPRHVPWLGINRWPFAFQDDAQPAEPHWSGRNGMPLKENWISSGMVCEGAGEGASIQVSALKGTVRASHVGQPKVKGPRRKLHHLGRNRSYMEKGRGIRREVKLGANSTIFHKAPFQCQTHWMFTNLFIYHWHCAVCQRLLSALYKYFILWVDWWGKCYY